MATKPLTANEDAEFSDTVPGARKGQLAQSSEVNEALQKLLDNTANLPITRTKARDADNGSYILTVTGGAVSLRPFAVAVEAMGQRAFSDAARGMASIAAPDEFTGGTVSTLTIT